MNSLPQADRDILRRLAQEIAQIAALPVHDEKVLLWKRLNDLKKTKPMVFIMEIPWHEMNVDDELTIRCTDPWARTIEYNIRCILYQWRHFPGDMILNKYISSPLAINSTGIGISSNEDIIGIDDANPIVSHHYRPLISQMEDIEKIKMPVVTHDVQASEREFQKRCDIFGDILPVKKEGYRMIWHTPWDALIQLFGVQEAMMDLVDRPEFIHAVVSRFVEAKMCELDQFESLGVLSLGIANLRIGSGGYGYTDELPGTPYDPNHIRPHNMWGCSNAQIFSDISPEMHWEFALQYDIPWLKRWGLTYYGCCEPLDGKLGILRRIPNLRKISMSPWIRLDRAVDAVGGDYVFSYKPNPAFVAEDRWRPELVRQTLKEVLEKTRGCHVELILKDISTVRYDPKRLWEWEKIAMELSQEYAQE